MDVDSTDSVDSDEVVTLEPRDRPSVLPDHLRGLSSPEHLVRAALANPIASPRLSDMVEKATEDAKGRGRAPRVVVLVDDITRPTPTRVMVGPVLEELGRCGLDERHVTVVFANGTHRRHSAQEKSSIVGDDVAARFPCVDHDASDPSSLVDAGRTRRGTPVMLNGIVADADLRVLTGTIKPHPQAGYTGGGKAILPGVCGFGTIAADHSFDALEHDCSVVGVTEGNPIRSDIEDAVSRVGPVFLFNVVLNREKVIVGAVAGHVVTAHREGVRVLDSMVKLPVPWEADVAVVRCAAPTDINFYQALNGIAAVCRLEKPVVRSGGLVVLVAACHEGVGNDGFYRLVSESKSPDDVLAHLAESSRAGAFFDGQWAAQIWARILQRVRVAAVAEGLTPDQATGLGLMRVAAVEQALSAEALRLGRRLRVLVLPHAPYTIPVLRGEHSQQ